MQADSYPTSDAAAASSAAPGNAGPDALHARFAALRSALQTEVIGQPALVDRLLIALLADGHLLVEGAPGLAKTTAIKALAARIEADFHRVQFTPDLLPADLTGTDVLRPQTGVFEFEPGPLFHNLVLADEINRAPAKVQSALLEAMAERQVTIGRRSWALPKPSGHSRVWPLFARIFAGLSRAFRFPSTSPARCARTPRRRARPA